MSVLIDLICAAERGLAGGLDSINNYGFELARGFKALKIWMSLKLKEHGRDKYAQLITQNNRQAVYLGNGKKYI